MPGTGTGTHSWRIRRLRFLDSVPAVLEDIWLDAARASNLDVSMLPESLYHFYQSQLGFWISRTEDSVGVGAVPDWAPARFGLEPASPCGVVDRIAWAQDAKPVEYSRSWFNPAIARYVARLI